MKIGKLRNRVEVQSKGGLDDGFGTAPAWQTDSTIYAQITELNGRELEVQKQINAEISVKIIVRYNTSIIAEKQIKHGTKIYNIISVVQDERKTTTTILCTEEK